MPELPEVETVKQAITPVLAGQRISHVRVTRKDLRWPLPENLADKLQGRICDTPYRRAKYILIPLEGEQTLLLHLGMSGAIRLYDSQPEFGKHDHFSIAVETGKWCVFSDPRRFGHIDLIANHQLNAHKLLSHLGPEPFSNHLSPGWLVKQLTGRKTTIKAALMDQRLIAGLGNIYVCEALFKAGISPRSLAHNIGQKRAERLIPAIQDILSKAIASGGTSLRDHVQPGGEIGYFVQQLNVYGRAGQACVDCETKIQMITQTGRSSFFCPHCQR